jgi:DNA polymerase III delta prime subunit
MKHVILYGPPAVGKLTVAEALGELTGWGVVHNHLSNNLVLEAFPYGHPEFSRLVISFRTQLFEAAAKARVDGLISTLVYAPESLDDKIIAAWKRKVAKHHGQTLFVRLHCKEATLFRRVGDPSRVGHKKIIEKPFLKEWLKRFDLFADVKGASSLAIDTDKLKPSQAAELIALVLGLPMGGTSSKAKPDSLGKVKAPRIPKAVAKVKKRG